MPAVEVSKVPSDTVLVRCVHCGKEVPRVDKIIRGLCRRCYYTPGVKELYPHLKKRHHVTVSGDELGANQVKRRPPEVPTEAMPGSLEKLNVLCERAKAGEELWHPEDVTLIEATDTLWKRLGGRGGARVYKVHMPSSSGAKRYTLHGKGDESPH